MKKILLILVLALTAITMSAQRENLDKMPADQRNKILLEIAKEVMLEYAPGYYNESPAPIIKEVKTYPYYDEDYPEKGGVRIYQVYYYYDKKILESDKNRQSMNVEIWADDGMPYSIGTSGGSIRDLYTIEKSLKNGTATRSSEVKKPYYKYRPPGIGYIFSPMIKEQKEQVYDMLEGLKGNTTAQAAEERKGLENGLKGDEIIAKEYKEHKEWTEAASKIRKETYDISGKIWELRDDTTDAGIKEREALEKKYSDKEDELIAKEWENWKRWRKFRENWKKIMPKESSVWE